MNTDCAARKLRLNVTVLGSRFVADHGDTESIGWSDFSKCRSFVKALRPDHRSMFWWRVRAFLSRRDALRLDRFPASDFARRRSYGPCF